MRWRGEIMRRRGRDGDRGRTSVFASGRLEVVMVKVLVFRGGEENEDGGW